MAESTEKEFGCTEIDRVSMLPREIQEIILCFLPIRDAVRTSILSKDWRHCWTTIPRLIFDSQFICEMMVKSRAEVDKNKFVSAINEVLLLHNGPVLKFSVCFYDYENAKLVCEHVSWWILLLSRNGIRQLTLDKYSDYQITANDLFSLNLTHLSLARFQFPSTPAYEELAYLTSLELRYAVNFGQSIFNCPVLEKLGLIICKGLSPTNFMKPNLKCIYEVSDQITVTGLENIREYSFGLELLEVSEKNIQFGQDSQ